MSGSRIAAVNTAIAGTLPEVCRFANQVPGLKVGFGAICFSNTAVWHIDAGSPVQPAAWLPIKDTGGVTALGQAYRLLAACLQAQEARPGQLPPVIVLLSDGMPTDDADTGLQAVLARPLGHHASRFAIGVGRDADQMALSHWVGEGHLGRMALALGAVELRQVVTAFTLDGMSAALQQVTGAV